MHLTKTIGVTLEIVLTPSSAGPEGSSINVCLQLTSQTPISITTDLIAMINFFQITGNFNPTQHRYRIHICGNM